MSEATIYKKRVKEGPSTTEPESVVGLLRFSCCSESWEVNLSGTGTCCCPDCGTVYQVSLRKLGRLSADETFPPGSMVFLSEGINIEIGSQAFSVESGWYRVGLDLFGVLPIGAGECFLEYELTTDSGETFVSLIRIKRDLLVKKVEEIESPKPTRDLQSSNSGVLADTIESRAPPDSGSESPDTGNIIYQLEGSGDSILEGGNL